MDFLLQAFRAFEWQNAVMWAIGGLLIFLAIKKKMEPALLLPMGIGAILVNIPLNNLLTYEGSEAEGILDWMFRVGIKTSEAMPILLFIGIGAMIDFGPLLSNPKLFLLGGAAQFGIFLTILLAVMIGFPLNEAASIGIIGAADGPTSILVAGKLNSQLLGVITVVAYSYMALVPIIQPAVIKCVTTKKERQIKMKYNPKHVGKLTKILFPIVVSVVAGMIAPESLALVGFLMFGNLIRECGVLDSMSETAQKQLANLITLLLGITIASQMRAEMFVSLTTLYILLLGVAAFVFDTIAGVFAAKLMNVFSKEKINPMIGAAGISAFPMSARVIQTMGLKEDKSNHLLMHAIGTNVSGQIASAIVGGLIIGLVGII